MKSLLLFLSCSFPVWLFSQGLIVNEVSNGTSGAKEFVELVVIGSAANPTGMVNLENWVIDDNNGDFQGSIAGAGISEGHMRFAPGCVSSVAPGTLLLLYNQSDLNFAIPPGTSDPTDSDGDCVYSFPANSACLQEGLLLPVTTNPAYGPTTYVPATDWTPEPVGLRNTGDVFQIRDPGYSFFHSICYGLTPPTPVYPAALGGGNAFILSGTGAGNTFFFTCGDFTDPVNFGVSAAVFSQTPGTPNNPANQYFINALRNGLYDYTNLANPANCGSSTIPEPCPATVLSLDLESFNGVEENGLVYLEWLVGEKTEASFEVERSHNGVEFETIGSLDGDQGLYYEFVDPNPGKINHYRLKMVLAGKRIQYSRRLLFEFEEEFEVDLLVNGKEIHFDFGEPLALPARITILDLQGRVVAKSQVAPGQSSAQVMGSPWPRGVYLARVDLGTTAVVRKFIW